MKGSYENENGRKIPKLSVRLDDLKIVEGKMYRPKELWNRLGMPAEAQAAMFADSEQSIPLRHIALAQLRA